MTSVLLTNNYPMRRALALAREGVYPIQHLYGYPLADGSRGGLRWQLAPRSIYELDWLGGPAGGLLRRLVVRLAGDPLQARAARQVDVVFAADQWSARGVLILRRLRLSRRRIVVLVHHPPRTPIERGLLLAADRLVFLSPATRAAFGAAQAEAPILPWGPGLDAEVYRAARAAGGPRLDFAAAGRTNRDYTALHAAAVRHGLTGVVYAADRVTRYTAGVAEDRPGGAPYPDVLADFARSDAVVIPLRDPSVMSGLTEIADAIALGRAIIVTRSPTLPYDIEGSRAGIVIDENTPEAIHDALERLRRSSGTDAGRLASRYNLDRYSAELDEVLTEVGSIEP